MLWFTKHLIHIPLTRWAAAFTVWHNLSPPEPPSPSRGPSPSSDKHIKNTHHTLKCCRCMINPSSYSNTAELTPCPVSGLEDYDWPTSFYSCQLVLENVKRFRSAQTVSGSVLLSFHCLPRLTPCASPPPCGECLPCSIQSTCRSSRTADGGNWWTSVSLAEDDRKRKHEVKLWFGETELEC